MILATMKIIKNLSDKKTWVGFKNDYKKIIDTEKNWETVVDNFDKGKLLYRKIDAVNDENTGVPYANVHMIWDSFDSFTDYLEMVKNNWKKLENAGFEITITIKHLTEQLAEIYAGKNFWENNKDKGKGQQKLGKVEKK
jgi:hypothetical protein